MLQRQVEWGRWWDSRSSPRVEVPARTRCGDSLTVQLTLSDVTLEDERRHVVAVIRDVTELRRTEHELRRVNDAMRRFVATASHDLRTPLASVLGFARLRPYSASPVCSRRMILASRRRVGWSSLLRSSGVRIEPPGWSTRC